MLQNSRTNSYGSVPFGCLGDSQQFTVLSSELAARCCACHDMLSELALVIFFLGSVRCTAVMVKLAVRFGSWALGCIALVVQCSAQTLGYGISYDRNSFWLALFTVYWLSYMPARLPGMIACTAQRQLAESNRMPCGSV